MSNPLETPGAREGLDLEATKPAPVYAISFSVLKGGKSAVLVTYPNDMADSLDGPFMEDNGFDGLPSEPGHYEAKAVFWFSQGYCDGYPADGESDWGYNLAEIRRLQSAPRTGEGLPEPEQSPSSDPTAYVSPAFAPLYASEAKRRGAKEGPKPAEGGAHALAMNCMTDNLEAAAIGVRNGQKDKALEYIESAQGWLRDLRKAWPATPSQPQHQEGQAGYPVHFKTLDGIEGVERMLEKEPPKECSRPCYPIVNITFANGRPPLASPIRKYRLTMHRRDYGKCAEAWYEEIPPTEGPTDPVQGVVT